MEIENRHSFLTALRNGVNLFLGAGFSILARNSAGSELPLGDALADELARHFSLRLGKLKLSQVCTILESKQRAALREYLVGRFTVTEFDPRYSTLDRVNIKTLFTTNIDDLLYKIFATSVMRYLNDLDFHGPAFAEKAAIDLVTLHGCILDKNRPLRFTDVDLASAFGSDPDRWHFFTNRLQQFPTLFWGYGLNDAGTLQSLSGETIRGRPHQEKWIVLHPNGAESDTLEYFKALDFQIVVADTSEMLDFLAGPEACPSIKAPPPDLTAPIDELLPDDVIPKLGTVPLRPMLDFFLGSPPKWSDIFSGNLHSTHHAARIRNAINAQRHVIIVGVPVCGKSTLLRQAAVQTSCADKLYYDSLTIEKAHFLLNKLGKRRTVVFIDNCTDSIPAIDRLIIAPNIQLVGADRDYNLQLVSHRVRLSRFDVIDVTEQSDSDIQQCLESIPDSVKERFPREPQMANGISPTLFEILEAHLREPTLRSRFISVLRDLRKRDVILVDMILMFAYVHNCRTPVSMDMLIAFLRNVTTDYREVLKLRNNLGEMVTDYLGPLVVDGQDYFVTRSESLARAILENGKPDEIKRMLFTFHEQISPKRICHYDVFRRRAYDADIAIMAFTDVEEGQDYYERIYQRDKSPYLLQQAALYMARKQRYHDAFALIDDAIIRSGGKIWSIRNSHAIILFRANIAFANDEGARETLKRSMSILSDCYNSDKRRIYHALTFADLAIQYARALRDADAMNYLRTAQAWLIDEEKHSPWSREAKRLAYIVSRQLQLLGE